MNCEMLYICEVLLSPGAAAAAIAVVIKIAAIKQGNTPSGTPWTSPTSNGCSLI